MVSVGPERVGAQRVRHARVGPRAVVHDVLHEDHMNSIPLTLRQGLVWVVSSIKTTWSP